MFLLILLLTLHLGSSIDVDCSKNKYFWRSYVFKDRKSMLMKDNKCMADVVPGAWCAWEPLETGHGVTICQKGLNIRWRRRLCNCPPPRPLSDPNVWCRQEKNASAVAQLVDQPGAKLPLTRLEALKSDIWISPKHWTLKWPFSRVSPVTNSLLGCLQLEDCYFHTGGVYIGRMDKTQGGSACQPWSKYKKDMGMSGMKTHEVNAFLASEPGSYCRNPYHILAHRQYLSARLKPWCFYGNYSGLWDYCKVSACGASRFRGTYLFPSTLNDLSKSKTGAMLSYIDRVDDRSMDVNAEGCFATCRFKCGKYAAMNMRSSKDGKTQARSCKCFTEGQIGDPDVTLKDPIDTFDTVNHEEYNVKFKYDNTSGPFSNLDWQKCYLYNTPFQCPWIVKPGFHSIFASVFELALPPSCHETNHLISDHLLDTMTVFGSMGNFVLLAQMSSVVNWVLLSSRATKTSAMNTMCSHASALAPHCPSFDGASLLDVNSYFNNVVDADYHWIIFDLAEHVPVALVELEGSSLVPEQLELLVRSATLPNWLSEATFKSSTGQRGYRTEYFRKATLAEQMLWWRCDDVKVSRSKMIYAECSPHQRTRWIMLRMKVQTDILEMKYNLGYHWINAKESCCIEVDKLRAYRLKNDGFNCIAMHHPPMGPEYADYWEDLYSFDTDGQPMDPPRITPVHPQFELPLLTHDSVHHEEKFAQEDWDVEACGNWELLENTTIVGVPAKLKITFTPSDPRGKNCYNRKQSVNPTKSNSTGCQRSVYFRVDSSTGEVVHYPDFGRSYDLTGSLRNCQFVCAIARECKAFEFRPGKFCRLHLISYRLDTMFAYAHNVIYGLKSDIMRTTNPFTWNNPFHPYYRLLQDLLNEAGFAH